MEISADKNFDFLMKFILKKQFLIQLQDLQQIVKSIIQGQMQNYDTLLEGILNMTQNARLNKSQNIDNQKIYFIVLMILDSLVFNIFAKIKNMELGKINNSCYESSLASEGVSRQSSIVFNKAMLSNIASSSQFQSQSGGDEIIIKFEEQKMFIDFFKKLLKNTAIFSDINQILNDSPTLKLKKSLSIFVQTLDYIMEKEQIEQSLFSNNRELVKKVSFVFELTAYNLIQKIIRLRHDSVSQLVIIQQQVQQNNQNFSSQWQ